MKWPLGRARAARQTAPLSGAHAPPVFEHGYAGSEELMAVWSGPAPPRDAFGLVAQELMARQVEHGRRGLALCATSAGAGVTFTSAQLALMLAQFGVSILLLDANLHDPRLHELIVPPDEPTGLLQFLEGSDTPPGAVIRRDVSPNLAVVYAGGAAANASELIGGDAFRDFVGACMRDFELTLVDTPGANRSVDSRWIAHLVGYALVVGRRDLSFVDDLDALVRELRDQEVEIIGTMLNGA